MTAGSATAPDLRSRLRGCLLAGAVGAGAHDGDVEALELREAFLARDPGY